MRWHRSGFMTVVVRERVESYLVASQSGLVPPLLKGVKRARKLPLPAAFLAQFPIEPGPRKAPFTHYRSGRNLEDLGSFLYTQSSEETQLYDLALARIHRREFFQRLVECEEISRVFS